MKLSRISFKSHPIIGDLDLNFRVEGGCSSVVYFAGENGTGKTIILNSIYGLAKIHPQNVEDGEKRTFEVELSLREMDVLKGHNAVQNIQGGNLGQTLKIEMVGEGQVNWHRVKAYASVDGKMHELPGNIFSDNNIKSLFKMLFSDVAINFTPKDIESVTAKNVDEVAASQKTSQNLATEITQLLIDVQSLDDADVSQWARQNVGEPVQGEVLDRRISRFQRAFSMMFPSKAYHGIRNVGGHKKVVFTDNGKECFIENLSSGEKQIVFRGGFFLKDAGATDGAVALIDEPEISLHPDWQLRIANFYKTIMGIGDNDDHAQLIVATHSPFILHNLNTRDESVVVLKRSKTGGIEVQETPHFYGWSHEQVIREAFSIDVGHAKATPLILVEGETDERYLNEATQQLEVNLKGAEIRWVGRIGEKGDAEFTGDKALNHTLSFALSNPEALGRPLILLYDSDTNKPEVDYERVSVRIMPFIDGKTMTRGIENLLELPSDINLDDFVSEKQKDDGYGITSTVRTLDKSRLCEHLLSRSRKRPEEGIFENIRYLFRNLEGTLNELIG